MPTTTTFANELKATNYASSPKSGAGYASTDLIQLYANDGTPNGKISRADLMSCVKDSLGSLLNASGADQSTNAAKVPTINSSGVLGSSTIANLASVLGGLYSRTSTDADTITTTGIYPNSNSISNLPAIGGFEKGGWGTLIHIQAVYHVQIYCGGTGSDWGYWIRFRTGDAWHPWVRIDNT